MNTRTRNNVLQTIDSLATAGGFTQFDLRFSMGKKRYTTGFDNTVGRFVRRLAANGILKRNRYGEYNLTARGRKYIENNVN
jgi:hypothetical protein